MKIHGQQGGLELPADEAFAALVRELEAATAGLAGEVGVLAKTPLLTRPGDGYERGRGCRTDAGAQASSVAARARSGEGAPVHEVLASMGALGVNDLDEAGRLFGWDPHADISLDSISTRKLLSFYEGSMQALHNSLGSMDFYRREGLWYERYREDMWRDLDQDAVGSRRDADYSDRYHYDTIEADRVARELELQRARDRDDYYRR